ncbi:hypothetical protein LTR36_008684 [Oleoguttula mirabilis]|uniref:Peptidase M12A domain-containing protein n=1 Tax=Oleoguttula mirabilis TaxID=1507867 RepID=A0AAV9JTA4_9PEZI|nr:hypothetical protein LTR36_008684 [Oleoguttula mirabilis]
MRIMPDLKCGSISGTTGLWVPNWDCLCTSAMDGTAVRIKNGRSATYTGYDASLGYDYSRNTRWRHKMKIGDLDPANPVATKFLAVRSMAHEFGHVMGLNHEHQRYDAAEYVTYDCKVLKGYGAALGTIGAKTRDDTAFTADMTSEERMARVCTDYTLAGKYFEIAQSYMPYKNADALLSHLESGNAFDARSIMMYPSWTGATAQAQNIMVLAKRADKFPGELPYIYTGGHPNPAYASISTWDIVRIAQLYPIGPDDATTQAAIRRATAMTTSPRGWGNHKFVQPGLWPKLGGGKLVMDSINGPPPPAPPVDAGKAEGSGGYGNDLDLADVAA